MLDTSMTTLYTSLRMGLLTMENVALDIRVVLDMSF